MTRVQRQFIPGGATGATVAACWTLSRPALLAHAPAPVRGALRPAGDDPRLVWRVTLGPGGGVLGAWAGVVDGPVSVPLFDQPSPAGEWLDDHGQGLVHAEVRAPRGVLLAITARAHGEALRVLYARTSLLADLRLPGGRYGPA